MAGVNERMPVLMSAVRGVDRKWSTRGQIDANGPKLLMVEGQSMSALPRSFRHHLFGNRERIVHLDAEIACRAFDLGVAEQELHCS